MAKPRTARDYDDDVTAASRSGLVELMTVLGAYRDALVLIGGWAPCLILEVFGEPGQETFDGAAEFDADTTFGRFTHVGSVDIDFVVNPNLVDAEQYATIVELLLDRGYTAVEDSRYQFEKPIPSPRSGTPHVIRIDFLTPRPLAGQGRSRRHRSVQRDLQARTLAGAEVALGHWFWYELDERLPEGAQARARMKVSDVVGSLALKGLAIGDRYAEKDAYDIFALCAHYRGGPPAVAEALERAAGDGVVQRGLEAMAGRFRDREAEGPTWVATFLAPGTTEEYERLRTDAFMVVREVLRRARISSEDA